MTENLDIMNMKEAAERAQENGIHMSVYTIRRAIKSGQRPCRIVGHTYLISWNNLVKWLECDDGGDNPAPKK